MKKIIISLTLIICIVFMGNFCAFGYNGNNRIYGVDTAEQDLKPDYEIFFNEINKYLYDDTDTYLTDEDFDYTKSLKIIIDTNIFEDEKATSKSMQKIFENATQNSDYVYYLPIYRNEKTYLYTVGKGLPARDDIDESQILTNEQIKYLDSIIGRWTVTEGGIIEREFDYIEALNEMLEYNNIENAKVYVVGGAASGLTQLAVICCENGDVKFNIMAGLDENNEIATIFDKNYKLYSYEEMKARVDKTPTPKPGYYGGFNQQSNNNTIKIAVACAGAVIIIAAAAVTVICIKKKKAKAAADLSE